MRALGRRPQPGNASIGWMSRIGHFVTERTLRADLQWPNASGTAPADRAWWMVYVPFVLPAPARYLGFLLSEAANVQMGAWGSVRAQGAIGISDGFRYTPSGVSGRPAGLLAGSVTILATVQAAAQNYLGASGFAGAYQWVVPTPPILPAGERLWLGVGMESVYSGTDGAPSGHNAFIGMANPRPVATEIGSIANVPSRVPIAASGGTGAVFTTNIASADWSALMTRAVGELAAGPADNGAVSSITSGLHAANWGLLLEWV